MAWRFHGSSRRTLFRLNGNHNAGLILAQLSALPTHQHSGSVAEGGEAGHTLALSRTSLRHPLQPGKANGHHG